MATKRTDLAENGTVYGTLSMLPHDTNGNGDIELYGGLYTDFIDTNTLNASVDIKGVLVSDDNITLSSSTQPTNAIANSNMFYTDTLDSKYKSVDSLGVVTVYQPTTTKGDLIVNDGTSTTRLPVGTVNQVLQADPSSITGLKWATNTSMSTNRSEIFTLLKNHDNIVFDLPVASSCISVYSAIKDGSSSNYIVSKSVPSSLGNIVSLNNNPSISDTKVFTVTYPAYGGVNFRNISNDEGSFKIVNSSLNAKSVVTLTGTFTTIVNASLTGAFFLSVSSDLVDSSPKVSFYACKSIASNNTATLTTFNSPSASLVTSLIVSWPSNSGILINKSTVNYNGDYNVVNNINGDNITVALTNTTSTIIPQFVWYTDKSFWVSVNSQVANGPCAVFSVSKNSNTLNGNISKTSSLGQTTLEDLNLVWGVNSRLFLNKTGNNYNGSYLITFTVLT
jgi:hypothetical protein